MIWTARLALLCGIALTGCHTVKRAAVTTFRVVDTPARYVRERIDQPQTTTTSTTTTEYATSDVVYPGRPLEASRPAPPTSQQRVVPRDRATPASPTPDRVVRSESSNPAHPKPSPRATPRPTTAAQTTEFPTAKPVPGKPGYVYSIDPKGGMVDVTGYKSGDKAKDPYTHQIFIVP